MKEMKLKVKRFFSIVLTMLLIFNLMGNVNLEVYAADSKVESAISWAIGIANDNSHGYSQSVRWGPHYDCSSFVYSAFYQAGFSLPGSGTRYTQTMVNHFTNAGFTWIPWSQIGSMSNLQRGDILLNNSSNSSKQHTEIYLGNGQNVGAHSPSKGISVSGYYNHPWLGVLRYGSSSAPTNPQISKSQNWYDLQDRIEISAYADGATSYFMSMFKDGNKIISQGVNGGKFSIDASAYGKGDYSAYFSCTNSAGTVDTKWIDFSVVGEPAYSDVRTSAYWFDLSDTVGITVDTICAKGQVIGIDKEGVGRVVTEATEPTYEIAASRLGIGNYSAYFTVYNGSGGIDTRRVDFPIVGPATYTDVKASSPWYDLTDTVSITVDTICAKGQVIGIDKEGVGRVVTEATEPTYEIAASKLGVGKYSAYFSVYNGSGGVDTKRVEFEIVNAPKEGAVISSSKESYTLDDEVQISVSAQCSKYQWLGIDKEGAGRIITERTTDGKYQISASELGKGKYSAYFTVYNGSGSYDTERVDFSIEVEEECDHDYISEITTRPTCNTSGTKTYICSKCNDSYTESIPATGHAWDAGKVTLEPTATIEGILTYTCTSCGETKTELIPATGQTENNHPDDKDNPDNKDKPDDKNNSDKDKTDTEDEKNPGKDDTDIEDEKKPDKDDIDSDDEKDSDREEIPDVDEESSYLEIGDVAEDAGSGDEYEVISMDGNVVCVEYVESANPKAAVIKIPATIKIEDGTVCKVTSISKCAFKNNRRLKKVVIGSNVTAIGTNAFSGCKNLTSVTIGKNVVAIGASAFSNCTKLASLTIPAKVEKIGTNAFSGCKKLKKLDIKSRKLNAKGLNKKAFKGIPAKTLVRVPKDKKNIYQKLLCQKGLGKKNKIR